MNILIIAAILGLAQATAASADQPEATPALTLGAAISEALRQSPELLPSEDAIASAHIQRQVAASRFSPKISPILSTDGAPAGLSQQSLGISVSQLLWTGAQVRSTTNVVRYGSGSTQSRDAGFDVAVSQPLLRGFGIVARAELDSARRGIEKAEWESDDARQQLVIRVAQGFFAVVRQQRLDEEASRALQRATTLREMSEARLQVGLATQLDVLRAGLLRSHAEASALRERDSLQVAREELNVLLGRDADSPIVADGSFAADIAALAGTGSEHGRQSEPFDVRDAKAQLEDARHRASIARWNLLPQINLEIGYTRRGIGLAPGENIFGLSNGWRVGVNTAYSLDRAADTASGAMADISVRAAERAVEDTQRRASLDLQRASRLVSRTRDVIAIHRTALDLAERQRELATMRYGRGLADNVEVIDAENNVFQAQSSLIGAEIDHALALLTHQRASGALIPDRLMR